MQFHKKNIKVMNYAKNRPHVLSWGVLKLSKSVANTEQTENCPDY